MRRPKICVVKVPKEEIRVSGREAVFQEHIIYMS